MSCIWLVQISCCVALTKVYIRVNIQVNATAAASVATMTSPNDVLHWQEQHKSLTLDDTIWKWMVNLFVHLGMSSSEPRVLKMITFENEWLKNQIPSIKSETLEKSYKLPRH